MIINIAKVLFCALTIYNLFLIIGKMVELEKKVDDIQKALDREEIVINVLKQDVVDDSVKS